MKKNYRVGAALALAVVLGVMTTTQIQAHSGSERSNTIVQKLAQKFGLKQEEVQAIFDEEQNTRKQEKNASWVKWLDEKVKEGKLTEVQKNALVQKHKELETKHIAQKEKWNTMSSQERKDAMDTQRKDLEDWAKQNNIDLSYFFGGLRHPGKGMGRGWMKR